MNNEPRQRNQNHDIPETLFMKKCAQIGVIQAKSINLHTLFFLNLHILDYLFCVFND